VDEVCAVITLQILVDEARMLGQRTFLCAGRA